MSKKKKQWLLLFSLSAVIVAMVAAYRFMPEGKTEDEGTLDAAQTVKIAAIAADSIQKINIQSDERHISLEKKQETWSWIQKKDTPVNTELVEKMVSALENVEATKELVYREEQMGDYGLQEPSLVLTITETDGKESVFCFGTTVPAVGGYYGTLNSKSGKLYSLAEGFRDTFEFEEMNLYQKDEVPTMTASYVTNVTVDSGKNGETFAAGEVSQKKQVEKYSTWNMTKPYSSPIAVNPDRISTIQTAYSAINLGELVEYNAKDIKKYGFSEQNQKVIVEYFDLKEGAQESTKKGEDGAEIKYVKKKDRVNKAFILNIGKKKDEDNYYVRINRSRNIYQMGKSEIISLMQPDVFDYADHAIYATLATELKGYEVTIGTTKIEVKREKKEDLNVWHVNGKKITEEQEQEFLKPYSALYLLEYSSVIKPDVKPKSSKPVVKIVYRENKRDVTISYLPYDGVNFYRVDKDGQQIFLSNMRPVKDMISKFKEMLKLVE